MEYDAYHKLSLAQIDTVDPVPQVTDVDAFVTATINQIGQNLGGSMPVATFFWALVFGASNAIANAFQAINMPPEFLQMFPYVATVVGLMLVGMTINRKKKREMREIAEKCKALKLEKESK